MEFWIFMGIMSSLIPLTMILFGYLFQKRPPQRNAFHGYRSARSLQSDETWLKAQYLMAKLWWKNGWILLVLSFVLFRYTHSFLTDRNKVSLVLGLLVFGQIIVMVKPYFSIEKDLKEHFDQQNKR